MYSLEKFRWLTVRVGRTAVDWNDNFPVLTHQLDSADASCSTVVSSPMTAIPNICAPTKLDTDIREESASDAGSRNTTSHWPGSGSREKDMAPSRELASVYQYTTQDDRTHRDGGPYAKVPVGVHRVYGVTFPSFKIEPIYWSPVKDIAPVIRGTWFYHENMLPVETEVANLLEAGYISVGGWTQGWKDELDRAVEEGPLGEMKILHMLWPDNSSVVGPSQAGTDLEQSADDSLKKLQDIAADAERFIDTATGPGGPDNKAAGSTPYGRDGTIQQYTSAGIIYANGTDAYILEPGAQPSDYYRRRPLANIVQKDRKIGTRVVRGFDQGAWDRSHPPKKEDQARKTEVGLSATDSNPGPKTEENNEPSLADSHRLEVTDLVLVIHGIGQKLSERIESYLFTHAINAFCRDVRCELVNNIVKSDLREGMGGIMVLPV